MYENRLLEMSGYSRLANSEIKSEGDGFLKGNFYF